MKGKLWQQFGLREGEYTAIKATLDREPNEVELGMYSVMWSEHCSYKSSKEVLRLFPTEGEHVLQGPGENAGIIDIGDGLAVVFKIESHNHPSAIEPYQGAATGVGGIIRDIFTMGARPVALLNSLRFGSLDDPRTRYLFSGVVSGIGGYGNCVGIPTVSGEVAFDDSYQGNPLVNAMCVGIIEKDKIKRGAAAGEGNLVLLVGASTGRDGLHGVTFASEELSDASEERRPAVQVGDPFMEKLLIEASLEVINDDLALGVQDLGGAGLTCATSEMAARGGTGMRVDLDSVPCREKEMSAYEIMLSESQERMLFVVSPENRGKVQKIFQRWGLEAAMIGKVTGDGILRIHHCGRLVASLPAHSLAEGPPPCRLESSEPAYYRQKNLLDLSLLPLPDPEDAFLSLLGSPNIADKSWVWQQYDHMVRTSTVTGPGSDAALIRLRGTKKGLAMTTDGNGRYVYLNPFRGGMIAVAEAARNLVCVGAKPLAVTDCLNFGNPENPEVFWQFRRAVEGMSEACRKLGTPVTGGNVSFYNENEGKAIFPTPVIGMVGLLDDIEKRCDLAFKSEGEQIVLLGKTNEELGASEYLKVCHNLTCGPVPELDSEREKALHGLLLEAIGNGLLSSAHDLSDGGLAVALAESCVAGKVGAVIALSSDIRVDALLFGESQSRVIVSLPAANISALEEMARAQKVPLTIIGVVEGKTLRIDLKSGERSTEIERVIELSLETVTRCLQDVIPCLMQ